MESTRIQGFIVTLTIRFQVESQLRCGELFIYAKKTEGTVYGREDKMIYEKMKETWKIKATEKITRMFKLRTQ
jgi:hypothetical protein